MKVLVYLIVPVGIVTAWCIVLWLRTRKPTSLQSGVEDFRREMQALSPEQQQPQPPRRSPTEHRRPPARPRHDPPGRSARPPAKDR